MIVDAIDPGLHVGVVRFWQRLSLSWGVPDDALRLGIWILAVEGGQVVIDHRGAIRVIRVVTLAHSRLLRAQRLIFKGLPLLLQLLVLTLKERFVMLFRKLL